MLISGLILHMGEQILEKVVDWGFPNLQSLSLVSGSTADLVLAVVTATALASSQISEEVSQQGQFPVSQWVSESCRTFCIVCHTF